jgi:hypothetical protein
MELEALPYTLLIILAEFSVGSLIAALLADARGMVVASFVKLSAVFVVIGAALTLLAAFGASGSNVGDYRLDNDLYGPVRILAAIFLAATLPYLLLVYRSERQLSLRIGTAAAAIGIGLLALIAYQLSAPTWSFAGVLVSVLIGALALGFVNESMVLGHWYLVSPKLPGRPLQELTFVLLVVVVVQFALVILNAAVPARDAPDSSAVLAGSLGSNPAFWLRVGVGLIFPVALAYMAWQSSREHAMMSATGLLYIAVGAVFTGELLGRGILFVTGAPV